jgi:SHS2 domain-containing protein
MPREFFDHTGDVGVRLSDDTLAGLFREAALAFIETLTDPETIRLDHEERVEVTASSLDDLMIAWLDELLYWFEVRNMLARDVEVGVQEAGGRWQLDALLRGEFFDAERHAINVLIKGVTYHQLDVRQTAAGWITDLVFDI